MRTSHVIQYCFVIVVDINRFIFRAEVANSIRAVLARYLVLPPPTTCVSFSLGAKFRIRNCSKPSNNLAQYSFLLFNKFRLDRKYPCKLK